MTLVSFALDRLIEQAQHLDEQTFLSRQPGHYLIAMGAIVADALMSPSAAKEQERTLPVSLGGQTQHDLQRQHPLAGTVFYFPPGLVGQAISLGRGEACEIMVPDDAISVFHCRLTVALAGLEVTDLNSTNGTLLNRRELLPYQPELLGDGDLLCIGTSSFQLLFARSLYAALLALRQLS